jgi:putative membrane protein
VTVPAVVLSAACGAAFSSILACVPGLHVYNVMGLMAMGVHSLGVHGCKIPAELLVPCAAGMIVGYAMLNTVPSVFLAAPDESAFFIVLPGQKYLMNGRGYEGTLITGLGGAAGLVIVLFGMAVPGPGFLPAARRIFQPHVHWILWCVICFMLMSEWPKGGTRGQAGWRRFLDGWRSTGAGLLTFLMAGLLGFVLMYRAPVRTATAFQALMPAFVGLFTIPWLILNIVSGTRAPAQTTALSGSLPAGTLLRGAFAGGLGGGFAAFFPVVTGGVGGFLAGHAAAIRDDRAFLVSQGASKLVYYVGAFLLFFVPGLHLTRGSGAWMLRGLFSPRSRYDFYMALAAVAIAGAISTAAIGPLARLTIRLLGRYGFRRISITALAVIMGLVVAATAWQGLVIMFVAACIGLVPVMFGARRMNCLGVILLPMACNMSGAGPRVAGWLGLL